MAAEVIRRKWEVVIYRVRSINNSKVLLVASEKEKLALGKTTPDYSALKKIRPTRSKRGKRGCRNFLPLTKSMHKK